MLKPIIKNHITTGMYESLQNLRHEFNIFLMHRRGLCRARTLADRHHLRLHLGCGSKIKTGWINIDFSSHADLSLDMREPLPFRDSCCSIIYSEHFLEHLSYPVQAAGFLKECYRILEPGGVFSVGVPDTQWPLKGYLEQSTEDYFRIAKDIWHPQWCRTKMEHINYHFRQDDDHRFAYDLQTLNTALSDAGFENMERREFDPLLDSEDRRLGTIYVNASKGNPV